VEAPRCLAKSAPQTGFSDIADEVALMTIEDSKTAEEGACDCKGYVAFCADFIQLLVQPRHVQLMTK
jgi:hypothetical protein